MIAFWHKPDKWIDSRQRWHAYTERGESLCKVFLVCGTKRPADSKTAKPRYARCGACMQAANPNRTVLMEKK